MSLTNTDPSEIIKERIRARLDALGFSANEASRKAGLGLSFISDLLNGKTKSITVPTLIKVADGLLCDFEYLMGLQSTPTLDPSLKLSRLSTTISVPLYSVTMADPDGFFPFNDKEVTEFRPSASMEPISSFYAVAVSDDTMAPRFMAGEIVCASIKKPVVVGSFVIVRLHNDRAIIRQITGINGNSIALYSIRDDKTESLARSDVKSIHRITATFEG